MKKFICIFVVQVFIVATVFCQVAWTKYQGNPILELGPAGSWDSHGVDMGSVLFDGSIYHLWYGGSNGITFRIGHATSPDGISWTKDSLNPVLEEGPAGSWDYVFVYLPNVLLNGSTFHMWYDGFNGSYEQIGHATSEDGSTWIKDPLNPVLEVGPPFSWDDTEIFPLAGSVIFEENVFKMWYGGFNLFAPKYNIGYATSMDGSIWIKDTINNPILREGLPSEWDGSHVVPGSVLYDGSIYRMWYSGSGDDLRYQIGFATSIDGIVWTKDTVNNPVLAYGPPGSWDYLRVVGASVLWNATEEYYMMWYSSGNWFFGRAGYATSQLTGVFDPIIQHSSFNIHTYPNPARGIVNCQFSTFDFQSIGIEIVDLHGREIALVLDEKLSPGKHVVKYDVSHLPAGVYILRLTASGCRQTENCKLLVQ